ncbi:MAG TPA: hypothetical protein VFE16_03195 [Candidatus Cybelea sp.]|jgi:hypothetical protein|nr:hypothetical protein [Candidatus Cybelea sp.]
MKAARGVLLVALALLAIAAIRDVARLGDALPWHQMYDFADFYCAGTALDRGADPYRYEPLHGCEHRVNTGDAYRTDARRVIPAPLPPYDFPPLALAARLSFSTARNLDALLIVLAIVAVVAGLVLTGVSLDVASLALVLPAGFVLLAAGQVVPFALVALVFTGLALARGRAPLAGIVAALTVIEPHLGLPVCAALFCWVPRSRIALTATLLVLSGIGVLTVGVTGIAEYLRSVLPAQAAAETTYAYQYSLTYLLRTLGVPASAALPIGELSYLILLLAGVWLGGRTARALRRPELVAYVAGACSVIAGPYVHMVDLPFAIPAALVFACRLTGRPQQVAVAALVMLAIPWIPVWIVKKLFLATLFVVAALLVRLRAGVGFSIVAFAAVTLAIYFLELAPPAPLTATTSGNFLPSDLAQSAWAAYVAALGSPSLTWLAVKIPSWAALCALIAVALETSRTQRSPAAP